jgi:type I restriction enzyme R subunit
VNEFVVEAAALDWFRQLGYAVLYGPEIAPGEPAAERSSYSEVVLLERLRTALRQCNPKLPATALEEALRKLILTETPVLVENNRRFHQMLIEGVPVEYQGEGRTNPDLSDQVE